MNARSFAECKRQIFETVAAMAASFGSPARLKILHLVAQAPRSVDAIAEATGESVANTSQHLRRLFGEGLVVARREGLSKIYRLSDPKIAQILEGFFDLAERVSPAFVQAAGKVVEADIGKPAELETALQGLKRKKAVLLDVREARESSESPVAGARAIPLEMLRQQAASLSRDKTYFIFCRGRCCDLATEAVRLLRALGFNAHRLIQSPYALNQSIEPQTLKENKK